MFAAFAFRIRPACRSPRTPNGFEQDGLGVDAETAKETAFITKCAQEIADMAPGGPGAWGEPTARAAMTSGSLRAGELPS